MFKSICAALAAALLLTACSVRGPRVEVDPGGVEIKPVTVQTPGSASHCPPGHAKKGWC
ncbi:MAG: hypothetical protein R3286_03435 [Gammaproteobacteria bacterium]|nr:hypothetical protein [Gammaproteobacteria bacterium]